MHRESTVKTSDELGGMPLHVLAPIVVCYVSFHINSQPEELFKAFQGVGVRGEHQDYHRDKHQGELED